MMELKMTFRLLISHQHQRMMNLNLNGMINSSKLNIITKKNEIILFIILKWTNNFNRWFSYREMIEELEVKYESTDPFSLMYSIKRDGQKVCQIQVGYSTKSNGEIEGNFEIYWKIFGNTHYTGTFTYKNRELNANFKGKKYNVDLYLTWTDDNGKFQLMSDYTSPVSDVYNEKNQLEIEWKIIDNTEVEASIVNYEITDENGEKKKKFKIIYNHVITGSICTIELKFDDALMKISYTESQNDPIVDYHVVVKFYTNTDENPWTLKSNLKCDKTGETQFDIKVLNRENVDKLGLKLKLKYKLEIMDLLFDYTVYERDDESRLILQLDAPNGNAKMVADNLRSDDNKYILSYEAEKGSGYHKFNAAHLINNIKNVGWDLRIKWSPYESDITLIGSSEDMEFARFTGLRDTLEEFEYILKIKKIDDDEMKEKFSLKQTKTIQNDGTIQYVTTFIEKYMYDSINVHTLEISPSFDIFKSTLDIPILPPAIETIINLAQGKLSIKWPNMFELDAKLSRSDETKFELTSQNWFVPFIRKIDIKVQLDKTSLKSIIKVDDKIIKFKSGLSTVGKSGSKFYAVLSTPFNLMKDASITTELKQTNGQMEAQGEFKYNGSRITVDSLANHQELKFEMKSNLNIIRKLEMELKMEGEKVAGEFEFNENHLEFEIKYGQRIFVEYKKDSDTLYKFNGELDQENKELKVDISFGEFVIDMDGKRGSNKATLDVNTNVPGFESLYFEAVYKMTAEEFKTSGQANIGEITNNFEVTVKKQADGIIKIEGFIKAMDKNLKLLIESTNEDKLTKFKSILEGSDIGKIESDLEYEFDGIKFKGGVKIISDENLFAPIEGNTQVGFQDNDKFYFQVEAKMVETILNINNTINYSDLENIVVMLNASIPALMGDNELKADLIAKTRKNDIHLNLSLKFSEMNIDNDVTFIWRNIDSDIEGRISGKMFDTTFYLGYTCNNEFHLAKAQMSNWEISYNFNHQNNKNKHGFKCTRHKYR